MNRMSSLNLLVVIVNYRTAGLTIDCLRSLEAEVRAVAGWRVRVVVTDNCSGDDSVTSLEAGVRDHGFSDWVGIEPLDRNGGFAYGNNAAIRPALEATDPPDYVWLLNPDTIVRPGALAALVDFLENHPAVGIAGSRLVNREGTAEWSAFRFPTVLGELEGGVRLGLVTRILSRWVISSPAPLVASRCDWSSGASLMVRRAVFEAIGLLDENYFMYFEEVDFCRRAHGAGWAAWYVPQSEVVHLAGQSSGVTDRQRERKRLPGYWFQARRYYNKKHLGPVRAALADLVWSLGFSSFRVRQWLFRKPDTDPESMLRDFVHYNFFPNGSLSIKRSDDRELP
jgi:N-acetylglucosaminyl-diphospho-decaprenol L-rhamnosyltransferase